jgi:hypothetical protein
VVQDTDIISSKYWLIFQVGVLPLTGPRGQVKTTVHTEETLLKKNKKPTSFSRKRGSDQLNADAIKRKGESVINIHSHQKCPVTCQWSQGEHIFGVLVEVENKYAKNWGSLSLVSTVKELLGRKSSGSGSERQEYGRRDLSR